MKYLSRKSALVTIHLAALVVLAACALTTSIRDIVENPRKYAGSTVTIEGEVTGVYSLIVIKYFNVDDGTGALTVITEKPLPKKGSRIKVKGTVQEAFSLGDQSMLVLIEENDKGTQN